MATEDEFLDAVKRGEAPAVADFLRIQPGLVRFAGEYDKTALHWAAENDHAEVARLLIDAGADIEATTSWGATPLEWAATMGSSSVADLLLERGAGRFSLVVAAALGKFEDVKSMLISETDAVSTALYAAARNGHTEVVEYLLDRGATIDTRGFFGGTGLHWAAINGHRDTVELLIARGASRSIRDEHFDSTPEEWAIEGGHQELAALLN